MVSKKVTIKNLNGMHLGPAGMFCDTAMRFDSHIVFRYGGYGEANAKSMLSVLGAGLRHGDEMEIVCEGADEEEALQALVSLVDSGFAT